MYFRGKSEFIAVLKHLKRGTMCETHPGNVQSLIININNAGGISVWGFKPDIEHTTPQTGQKKETGSP